MYKIDLAVVNKGNSSRGIIMKIMRIHMHTYIQLSFSS